LDWTSIRKTRKALKPNAGAGSMAFIDFHFVRAHARTMHRAQNCAASLAMRFFGVADAQNGH